MSKLFSWFKKDKESEKSAQKKASTAPLNEDSKQQDALQETDSAQLSNTNSAEIPQSLQDDSTLETQAPSETEQTKVTPPLINKELSSEEHRSKEPLDETSSAAALSQELPTDTPNAVLDANEEAQAELQKPVPQAPQAEQPESAKKPSLFSRLKTSLARTKANIGSGFSSLLTGKSIDDELYEDLETQLLIADVGMSTTTKIISTLTEQATRSALKDGSALSALLQKQMQGMLDEVNQGLDFSIATDENGNKTPFVILMVGVNGVGKTTTIGKLAKQFQANGQSVMLAAGDTFRAAAVEQLQVWGERNDIPVVAQHTGADSASVIFDAIASAKSKNVDVLIADTAGRLQNKDNLIEELKKVVRVMKKLMPNAPHEIMLTLDASTGQNAVSQTKIFNEAVGITGINLTKLDGSAKGGVIFALADEFKIPVRYIGIGEGIDDLREFESTAFVEALFAE